MDAGPKDERKPPLAYELRPNGPVSRRQFRFLLALVVLNLLISIQANYAPGVSNFIKEQWAEHKRKVVQAAAVKQAAALEQQAMNWSQPPGTVVWDEDLQTAAKLLGGPGYKKVRVEGLAGQPALANWPHWAAAKSPALLDQVWGGLSPLYHHPFPRVGGEESVEPDEYTLVFMHGLRTPAGAPRLVCVYVRGKLSLREMYPRATDLPGQVSGKADRTLRLMASPCLPGGGDKPITLVKDGRTTLLVHPEGENLSINWAFTPGANGHGEQFDLKMPDVFRFYAGQPDPADPSHFTIDYDLNGQRGTIHGYLRNDDSIQLKPAAGKTVGDRWYPRGQ